MAGAAIDLASRAGDYVVGETTAVDGGGALADALHSSVQEADESQANSETGDGKPRA